MMNGNEQQHGEEQDQQHRISIFKVDSNTPLEPLNDPSRLSIPSIDSETTDTPAVTKTRRLDFDPAKENHYLFVVHGTFDAPPSDGMPTWYQLPEPGEQNFCSKLAKLLERGGVIKGDAIWKPLPCEAPRGIPYPFHWDGTNTHEGRVDAATKLHRLIDMIADNDPAARIHLVAHSHGGNVVLKTLDLYMKLLSKKERRKEISPVINEAFWRAYKRPYEMIQRWRVVHLDHSSLWKFFPFLILWRNADGHVASRGQCFPWGYQKWWDSILGLGKVRQQMFLQQRIVTSPITNALGAIVFLGTPFYVKKWEDFGFVFLAINILCFVVVAYIMMTIYVFVWKIIIQAAMHQGIADFTAQPYISFTIAAAICVFVLASILIQTSRTTVFRSGNLYHFARFGWSPAMSALVIHAGKLDEASLALSTEPIVRAYVFPQLTKLLKQTPWQPLPKTPTIYDKRREWFAFFFNYFMAFFWDVIFFFPALLLSLISYVIAPIVTGIIQKVVVTISFGLAPGELNFAYVYVDEYLHLEELHVNQVDHWNVQKLLAQAKTRSLQGLLLEGYEDDTVEQPEWLEAMEQPTVPTGSFQEKSSNTEPTSAASPMQSTTPPLGDAGRNSSMRRRSIKRARVNVSFKETPSTLPGLSESEAIAPTQSEGVVVSDAQHRNWVPTATTQDSTSSVGVTLSGDSLDPTSLFRTYSSPKSMRIQRNLSVDDEEPQSNGQGVQQAPITTGGEKSFSAAEKPPIHFVGGVLDHSINRPLNKLVYDFLWDDEVLESSIESSLTYKLLKEQKSKIDHNPRLANHEFERQLKAMCLMIEERINELTGRVDLNHGAYFRDPRILRVIAHYISHRQLPDWSREIDVDISRLNDHLRKIESQSLLPNAHSGSSLKSGSA